MRTAVSGLCLDLCGSWLVIGHAYPSGVGVIPTVGCAPGVFKGQQQPVA
jgi:hypothetical protein